MDASIKGNELIDWLKEVNDFNLLLKIEKLKNQFIKSESSDLLSIKQAKQMSTSMIDEWEKN